MIIRDFQRTQKLPWAEISRLDRLEEVLFCRESKRKSLSLLVRIDQRLEFHAWKLGCGNGCVEGSSQHLLTSNIETNHTVTLSLSLPPDVSLRVKEYGEGGEEARINVE